MSMFSNNVHSRFLKSLNSNTNILAKPTSKNTPKMCTNILLHKIAMSRPKSTRLSNLKLITSDHNDPSLAAFETESYAHSPQHISTNIRLSSFSKTRNGGPHDEFHLRAALCALGEQEKRSPKKFALLILPLLICNCPVLLHLALFSKGCWNRVKMSNRSLEEKTGNSFLIYIG